MTPVSAGFSVIFDISVEKFAFWAKRSGVPEHMWDHLYETLSGMMRAFEEHKNNAGFDEVDIDLLNAIERKYDKA